MSATVLQFPASPLSRESRIVSRLHLVRPIARSIHHKVRRVSIEDLESAGVLGLIEACDNYDPAREATFDFYARQLIRGRILDSVKEQIETGQDIESWLASVDTRRFHSRLDLRRGLAELPPRQRQVIELRLEGYAHGAIAARLRIRKQSVASIEARAIEALRKRMNTPVARAA